MTRPNLSSAIFAIYRVFPPNVRFRLKSLLGINGHASGFVDCLKANRHARESKRLDRAMVSLTTDLTAAEINSLVGARCLEVGAGFVLTHAASLYLLGAAHVTATDLNRIASLEALTAAILKAPSELVISALPSSANVELARSRLNLLCSAVSEGWDGLRRIGIDYLAPIDLSSHVMNEPLDFIYSVSVLEHIPEAIVVTILQNLSRSLSDGGLMVHAIHLEDHRDMFGSPFEFLRKDSDYDPEVDTDTRGNRLRADDWVRVFQDLEDTTSWVVSRKSASEIHLDPDCLADQFRQQDPESVFCSNMTIKARSDRALTAGPVSQ